MKIDLLGNGSEIEVVSRIPSDEFKLIVSKLGRFDPKKHRLGWVRVSSKFNESTHDFIRYDVYVTYDNLSTYNPNYKFDPDYADTISLDDILAEWRSIRVDSTLDKILDSSK